MANEYIFPTKLEGFIRLDENGGKYNNRCFSFQIDSETLKKMEADRVQLLKWLDTKPNTKGAITRPPKWEGKDVVSYNYDGEKQKAPIFVDTDGTPLTKDVLKSLSKGTEVQLIVQQKPYCVSGVKGTSFQVIAARVHKLVTYSGASDKGELSIDDINSMFLKTEGYKQEQPVVTAEPSSYEPSYEVDF